METSGILFPFTPHTCPSPLPPHLTTLHKLISYSPDKPRKHKTPISPLKTPPDGLGGVSREVEPKGQRSRIRVTFPQGQVLAPALVGKGLGARPLMLGMVRRTRRAIRPSPASQAAALGPQPGSHRPEASASLLFPGSNPAVLQHSLLTITGLTRIKLTQV